MNKASFLFFLKILFTSLVFYFLLNKLDFTLVKTNLGKLSSKAFIFSVCWVWIGIATSAKRWQEIMACNFQKLPFLELWRQTIIGSFLNQCLPSSVGGDVYRGYMAKRHGLSTEWAISSTLIDRLYGLMSLVFLGVLALPFEFSTLLQSYLGLSIIIRGLYFTSFLPPIFFHRSEGNGSYKTPDALFSALIFNIDPKPIYFEYLFVFHDNCFRVDNPFVHDFYFYESFFDILTNFSLTPFYFFNFSFTGFFCRLGLKRRSYGCHFRFIRY